MLDIKLIRDKPDFIKAELGKRCVDPAEIDGVLEADAVRRKLQANLDEMRADRKRRSREIGKLPPDQRAAAIAQIRQEEADENRASVLANAVEAAAAINSSNPITLAAAQLALAEREVERLAMVLPNIPRPYVVVGSSEADNRVLRSEGAIPEFISFTPQPHWEI